MNEKERRYYLNEIKKDITYFGKTYSRANIKVDIAGLNQDEAALKIKSAIETAEKK